MPHFGLIPHGLSPKEELMFRAKLHVRGGRIRYERGEIPDAIAAFYDSFISAMRSKAMDHSDKIDDSDDEKELFNFLREKGIINSFTEDDFESFQDLLDRAFRNVVVSQELGNFLDTFNRVMSELGVIPIKDGELPEEQSVTL
ncbi:MAG: hypothetical protein BAJATHORv1_30262 [Candidatus Thorarchaeota archaeon]|nr:MAG: hypothetical protein BAJATHORv1_30262 [Candidatus Thorarchaeota archaeon]